MLIRDLILKFVLISKKFEKIEMHGIINILPDHIANQIAAGEVVQRPASVVKELIENAIDAGAMSVQVNIKDAGKTLIQVIDDGKGMSAQDAENCFLRHATSKISTVDDLFHLSTKGFRGEALASIAAVAQVSLTTKRATDSIGSRIQIEGSSIILNEECVTENGTNFEVRNLFYNIPARRNFLKSNDIEFRHIREDFERVALAHPSIRMRLINNGQEVYNLHAAVLRKRIVDVIGDRQNERLVPIEEDTSIVSVRGYVVKPEFAKKSRGEQFLFVNDRYFKDTYFNNAITRAFDGMLQPKSFPGYFLYFTIDPTKIDVNVHPTKTEIKFEEDKSIYAILISSIRQALGKYNIAPTLDFDREMGFDIPHDMRHKDAIEPQIQVNPNYNPFANERASSSHTPGNYTSFNQKGSSSGKNYTSAIQQAGFGKEEDKVNWDSFYAIEEETENTTEELALEIETFSEETPVNMHFENYILKDGYLFLPNKQGLMIVHSGRAQERILYDEMMGRFIIQPIASQTLLFPVEKEVSKTEEEYWNANYSLISRLGFEGSSLNQILSINAIPNSLEIENLNTCIDDLLGNLMDDQLEKGDLAHAIIISISKNASNRLNLLPNKEAVEHLINALFQCSEHVYSPNGKLILQNLPITDVQQLF